MNAVQIGESMRNRLHQGERVYGTHVVYPGGPDTLDQYQKLALDFVFIDTEHTPLNRYDVSFLCRHFAARGISPIVRITWPDGRLAAMALDGGAQGIVAPYVETVEQVKDLVGAVRYRPLKGKLLHEILHRSRHLNPKTQAYVDEYNRDQYLIIGIESVEAYQRLDALLAVPDVDGIFIGPHDLTVSMEIPEEYNHPVYLNTVLDIIKRSREAQRGVGMHLKPTHIDERLFRQMIDHGMNWILYYHDQHFMLDAMHQSFQQIRRWAGEDAPSEGSNFTHVYP